MNNKLYTIQETADILGVSTKTLRRWDQRGRFVPTRTAGNQRRYTQEQIQEIKNQKSKIKNNMEARASVPQGEPFFKPETPKEFKPVHSLPSILSGLPSGSFLKNHFLLKRKARYQTESGKDEIESKESLRESAEPAIPAKAEVNPFKIGFVVASLVLALSFAGAFVLTKYNVVAGLPRLTAGLIQTKEKFAKFISNLSQISLQIGRKENEDLLGFVPQKDIVGAVLAVAEGASDLILNVNVPSFFSQQMGIGTTTVDPSALLDISSEDKGFLAPRMTTVQRDAITSPAAGLFVYNTDTNHYNMYNGTAWQGVFTSLGDSTAGEAFTEKGTSGNSLYFHGTGGGVGQVTGGAISGTQTYTLPGATGTFITTGNLTDITKVGTIGSGVWNGTTLTVANGGTGATTLTGIVLGNGTSVMTGLTTSLGISGAITDETGTGALVFGTSPAITTSLTTASTTFALLNTTATTVNFAGAATTLSIGATTGTVTLNNATTAITGALTANGNVTLGDAATDTLTFTGRVAQDSDLIPIGTTGTNDLGSSALPWDNLYADNMFAALSGTAGYWQRNSAALSPTNITDDVLIGATSTSSAKFGFLNVAGGNPTATISGNLSLIVPTTAGANTFNFLNNSTLNFQRSPGGDAGLATALFIQNNGNVGIGNTAPGAMLSVGSSTPALISSAGLVTIANTTDSTSGSTGSINTLGGLGVTKDLAVDGGDIVTAATTFNLINTTATTLNFGGAATTLTVGATTGTASIRNATVNFPNATAMGIGNTAPLTALDVTGSASLSANLSLRGAGTAHTFNILDNGTLNIRRSPGGDAGVTTALFIQGDGNVGIGLTAPTAKLEISGGINLTGAQTIQTTTGNLTMGTGGGNGNIILSPNGTGNVGIKASTPTTFDLEVGGNIGASTGSTYDLGSSARRWNNVYGVTGNFTNLSTSLATISGTTTQDFLINSDNATADTEDATLTFSRGTGNTNSQLKWNSTTKQLSTNSPSFAILPDTTIAYSGTAAFMVNQIQAQDILTASASGVAKFVINNNGNVGIGTTAPAYKLDIATATASDRGINIANTAATGTNYGVYSSVTGAATANIGGYFAATGATTSRGLEVAALTSATSTGLTIGALSGTTADTGITIGAISGAGATGAGITIGNISTTGTTNYGINLGTMTGGTTSNYQINTGVLTSATTTTNAQLNLGGVVTTGGTTNYGINVGALSGTGTTNYGVNVNTLTSTGTTNYGLNIGGATGAATTNYGILIGAVSGATTNYGLYTTSGTTVLNATSGNVGIGNTAPLTALDVTGSASLSANLSLRGAGTAHTFNILDNGTLNIRRSPGGDAGVTTALLFLQNNGNVGIGNTAPAATLDITGTLRASSTVTFTGLTASRALFTDASSNLAASGASSDLLNALSDETGTGVAVFGTAPTFTTSITDPLVIGGTGTTSTLTLRSTSGVGAAGADIIFQTGNNGATEAMRILNSGFVGIANTAPLTALDVTGSASLSANLSLRGAGTAHTFNILDNGTLNIRRSPGGDAGVTTALFIQGDGNVGIGTTSPATILQVAGAITPSPTDGGALGSATLMWSDLFLASGGVINFNNGDVTLTHASNKLTLAGGNLDVDSNNINSIGTANFVASGDLRSAVDNSTLGVYGGQNSPYGGGILLYGKDHANNGQVLFQTPNAAEDAAVERLTISGGVATANVVFSNSNVGIGNTAPLTALDVTGSASLSANLSLRGAATAHTFNILDNGTLNFQRSPGGDAGVATALFIQNNGNVGIGTTAPTGKLDVSGTVVVNNTITGWTNLVSQNGVSNLDFARAAGLQMGQIRTYNATFDALVDRLAFYGGAAQGSSSIVTYEPFYGGISAGNDLYLRSTSHATKGDVLIADDGGNVGIGTTAPTSFLHVDGAATTATAAFARAFVDNTNAITTNTGATAVYGLMIDEPNITIGTATPTTSASLYISGAATEATTNYGIQLGAMTGATSTGLDIGALSGTTANKSLNIGAISGTGATGAGITIGNISTTGATNYGITLGTMTGGTTSNYQINTGVLTSATTTTNAQLNLGGVVTTGGTTNYGINVGALSGTGTTNYGVNVNTLTSTGTTNYGLNIGGATGAATTNYGILIGAVSGATTNYGLYTTSGTTVLNATSGNVGIGNTAPLTALDVTGSASLSANLSLRGAGTAHTFNILDNGTLNIQRSPGGDAGLAANSVLYLGNNGNVGIGTTGPAYNLQIAGGSTALAVGTATSKDGRITFLSSGSGEIASYIETNSSSDLALEAQNGWISYNTENSHLFRVSGSEVMRIGGNVGIGTTNPLLRLDVQTSQDATAAAQIYNTSSNAGADGLIIKLGNTLATVASTNHFISFETFGIGIVGSVQGNGGTGVTYATSGIADFAEYFKKDQSELIPFGSVVCLKDNGLAAKCDPSAGSGQGNIIGVASEHPAFLGGENLGDKSIAVGLVGQVRTRVSTANGAIKIGDPLTTSGTSGVAVKATSVGQILGKAIEPFDGNTSEVCRGRNTTSEVEVPCGDILVSVNISWYNPSIYVSYDGTLAGMADTVTSIGDQLTIQGEQLALQGDALQSWQASQSAQMNYVLANDPLFDSLNNKAADLESKFNLLSQKIEQQASTSAFLTEIVNSQVLGASTSAALALGEVELNSATVAENFMVLGRTTVTDLGVTGNINAGLLAIHGLDGEINTLSGNLYLQKDALGGVNIFDGKIVMDTKGNLTVTGTITANRVEANNYTVLGDQSIGSGTIPTGAVSVEISTPVASISSKIFLTTTSLTDKQITVVEKSDGKFKVGIPQPTTSPISFDWWIVGNK